MLRDDVGVLHHGALIGGKEVGERKCVLCRTFCSEF